MIDKNNDALDTLCVNAIRTLSIDAIQKANSGHPGLPMGSAPMAYALWQGHLKHNPKDPAWPDRDRFVLSAGHGSMLLYSLLHLTGYDLSLDDLKDFRQWESLTPGHPEFGHTAGVEATTGPLGQGAGVAVGMALAERRLANMYNRPGHEIVDHYTYALVADGDVMEGVAQEAASLAGHLKLGKLILLYDSNDVTLDGPASLSFSEDVLKRYESYGWHVQRVDDGDTDLDAIDAAIKNAKAETGRPSIIEVKTTIGYGSPKKQGTASCHGSPLGEDEVAAAKTKLGWDPDKAFHVPDEALAKFRTALEAGAAVEDEWKKRFDAWAQAHPDLAAQWELAINGGLPDGWDSEAPAFTPDDKLATRVASGKALNGIAAKVPWLMGGDADLSCSTKTALAGEDSFDGQTGAGRNLHFGVREHAMGAIANGMAYHKGLKPYVATFFVFCDYMRPSVRLAAMNGLPVVYVWTHDSVAVGEDGPTHQPIEHVTSLRLMPGLTVMRPGDPTETVEAWRFAMEKNDGPVALVLSRQGLPALDRAKLAPVAGLRKGAYVVSEAEGGAAEAIIIATGAELQLALDAQTLLASDGIKARVVSMPCWELFAKEDAAYRESVLPSSIKARVSVEAGSTLGWERWIGESGLAVGIDRFGASAPGGTNLDKFGFNKENVAAAVKKVLG